MTYSQSKNQCSKKDEIWIYSILVLTSSLAAFLAVRNIFISPDSITYSLASQQILEGNGIRVSMIWFDSKLSPVDGTVPMLIHPPLLPVLFALFGSVTPQSYFAAQIINFVCHVSIAVFSYLLMKQLYDSKMFALLSGALVSVSLPLLNATRYVASETLFTVLIVATVYFLIRARNSDSNKHGNIILASICASASIFTRNAGVAIVIIFLWELFISLKNKKPNINYKFMFLATLMPVLSVLTLFGRNFLIAGMIRGDSQPPIRNTCFDAFVGTISMLFQQFQMGKNSILLIIGSGVFVALVVAGRSDVKKELLNYVHRGLDIIAVFTISYIALIIYAITTLQPQFELRFMYPLVPFLFTVCMIAILLVYRYLMWKLSPKLSVMGLIIFLSLLSYGTIYKTYTNLQMFNSKQDKIISFLNSCVYKWVDSNYEKNVIITTNQPYYLSFFGGFSTVILPHKRWAQDSPIPEDMALAVPQRMSEVGSKVLVLFEGVNEYYDGTYIANLYHKKSESDSLVLAHECADGVVYHLK